MHTTAIDAHEQPKVDGSPGRVCTTRHRNTQRECTPHCPGIVIYAPFAPQSTQVLFSGRCMMAFKALCCLDDILLVHTRFPGRKRRCCLCYAQTHTLVVENRH